MSWPNMETDPTDVIVKHTMSLLENKYLFVIKGRVRSIERRLKTDKKLSLRDVSILEALLITIILRRPDTLNVGVTVDASTGSISITLKASYIKMSNGTWKEIEV